MTAEITAAIAPALARIVRWLDASGLKRSRFAIVFGHVLDGLFSEALAARGALPETELDAAHRWWRGAFWAISARARHGPAGVNMLAAGNAQRMQVWTAANAAELRDFAARPDAREALGRAVGSGSTLRVGGLDLPVVRDLPGDSASVAAETMASRFVAEAAALCPGVLPTGTDPRIRRRDRGA